MDSDSYRRLEMGVIDISVDHIQRNRAVGEKKLVAAGLREIDLEARLACHRLSDSHGQQSWDVALACACDALGIKDRKCHAAGVADCRKKVEATYGKTVQRVLRDDSLECAVDHQSVVEALF